MEKHCFQAKVKQIAKEERRKQRKLEKKEKKRLRKEQERSEKDEEDQEEHAEPEKKLSAEPLSEILRISFWQCFVMEVNLCILSSPGAGATQEKPKVEPEKKQENLPPRNIIRIKLDGSKLKIVPPRPESEKIKKKETEKVTTPLRQNNNVKTPTPATEALNKEPPVVSVKEEVPESSNADSSKVESNKAEILKPDNVQPYTDLTTILRELKLAAKNNKPEPEEDEEDGLEWLLGPISKSQEPEPTQQPPKPARKAKKRKKNLQIMEAIAEEDEEEEESEAEEDTTAKKQASNPVANEDNNAVKRKAEESLEGEDLTNKKPKTEENQLPKAAEDQDNNAELEPEKKKRKLTTKKSHLKGKRLEIGGFIVHRMPYLTPY